ncbi:MAG: hypothetical protein ABIE07_05015 [Candidatus Zixiibacteriota bacterium]
MRPIRINPARFQKALFILLAAVIYIFPNAASRAEYISIRFVIQPMDIPVQTDLAPFAEGSDSIYCGGRLLNRDLDYRLHHRTGNLKILTEMDCDSIDVRIFRLPKWMFESLGNIPGEGKKFISLPGVSAKNQTVRGGGGDVKKINLSGSKSFAFNVGQTGQSNFSQGLSVDFDTRIGSGLEIRGSVSDKASPVNNPAGPGGSTTLLSELDKYYFEIRGRRLTAQAGDILSISNTYLPQKRIMGVASVFKSDHYKSAVSIGRPAGKFHIARIRGGDGKQGPYQVNGRGGVPVSIVAGSEKVYVDGQLLEGRTDRHYVIDYAAGRITFSPGTLITSRSRIEIDFEEADNKYQQAIYELSQELNLLNERLRLSFGGRREVDEKDRLRFLSLSPADIVGLSAAGDSTSNAFQSGAAADSAGEYELITDTTGTQYYNFVGRGNGGYSVQFSFVGEDQGDYIRLGENIFQFTGAGQGDYLPVRFLPLPASNSFFYSAAEIRPYNDGKIAIEYHGNDRDENLFSSIDDEDNYRGQIKTVFTHHNENLRSETSLRYQSANYNPVYRVDVPDNNRMWALPEGSISGDEFRIESEQRITFPKHAFILDGGIINFGKSLKSYRINFGGNHFIESFVSPRYSYQMGHTHNKILNETKGLFEKYSGGMFIKGPRTIRMEVDYFQELTKDLYGDKPDIEKYTEYKSTLFIRNSVVALSRRLDYQSDDYGRKGPRLDKVTINSDENLGRLRLNLTGTLLNQKRLDSFREDRTARMFATAARYLAPDGWLSLQADYRQNSEQGKSSEFRYIEVESGQGNYRFEDGQYFFDIAGDIIRIRQEVGQAASITRGEKSHNLTFNPGRARFLTKLSSWLDQFSFRMRSEIIEEASGKDKRHLSWILPWTSQSGVDYINRARRERYTFLLFPRLNFYVMNFIFTHNFSEQDGGRSVFKDTKNYNAEIKNAISSALNSILKYNHGRTEQRGGGLIPARLRTSSYGWALLYFGSQFQITPELEYIRFNEEENGGRGVGLAAKLEAIARFSGRGEFRIRGEFRDLSEKERFIASEYFVTDGNRFGKSGHFSMIINYKIGKTMRITGSMRNRFFENRKSEFTGRGELIALF